MCYRSWVLTWPGCHMGYEATVLYKIGYLNRHRSQKGRLKGLIGTSHIEINVTRMNYDYLRGAEMLPSMIARVKTSTNNRRRTCRRWLTISGDSARCCNTYAIFNSSHPPLLCEHRDEVPRAQQFSSELEKDGMSRFDEYRCMVSRSPSTNVYAGVYTKSA